MPARVLALGEVPVAAADVVTATPAEEPAAPISRVGEYLTWNNLGLVLLVTTLGAGAAWMLGARRWNGQAALFAALATVPGLFVGGATSGALYRATHRDDSSSSWAVIGWLLLGALAGAGLAAGGTYAYLERRK